MNQTEYKEFVEARKNYLGASDAPAVMGVSKWMTPYQLWEDKLGLAPDKPDNYAMKRGRELEPIAREAYTLFTGNVVAPKQVFHAKIRFMMANFDGLSQDLSVAVEIKCPGEKDHGLAKEGRVPEKYMPQLQHQLAVIGLDELDYFSYKDGDTALIKVKRDDRYIKDLYIKEKLFWQCVESLSPPPKTEKDLERRHDRTWASAAVSWAESNKQLKHWKEQEEQARQVLIHLGEDKNSIGQGVKLERGARKGAVNYKSIPELEGVDLEKYRKDKINFWRVTPC